MSFWNKIHRPVLSWYDPSSGFMFTPTGKQPGRGSQHPAGRDAAPPNGLCSVSEPAPGHHRGRLWSLPWARGAPGRGLTSSRVSAAGPRPPLAPAPGPSRVVPCTHRNGSLFSKQRCRTRASSYGNKPSSSSGGCALLLFAAVVSNTGHGSISAEAPERRWSVDAPRAERLRSTRGHQSWVSLFLGDSQPPGTTIYNLCGVTWG